MTVEQVTQLPTLPPRDDESHKGTYGRVLIVAGSRGMAGAAGLSGLGALRGGAGLVYLAVPTGIANTVSAIEPSYLTSPLPEDEDGRLAIEYREEPFQSLLDDKQALAIGPGLGQSRAVAKLVTRVYEKFPEPAVFDADALNALARQPKSFDSPGGARILTPHPGEFARLLETDVKTVQANREELAVKFAAERGVILLLKGHRTLITDGKKLAVNETGNSGMATGGCGDVLTGLIAALLGQRLTPFDAAQFGAYLHGLAGDLAAEELSRPGLIASDLTHYLARAWRRIGQ